MSIQRLNQTTRRLWHLRPVVAGAACLYMVVNAFLILCLAHPHDSHSHSQADTHLDVVCIWVQKAVSSHVPSTAVMPSVAEAVVFVLLSFPLPARLVRILRLTGRSPPNTPSFA